MSARITVCRGCCCGTERKHPEVDHDRQLELLRSRLAAVKVADCLDACEVSNVVVVQPSPAARAAGAKPVWVGSVLDDDAVHGVADWVDAGGPGLAAPPAAIATLIVDTPGPE
ncbi:hypothetical protein ABZX92_24835 [Lentzea sp. NPDC006480]|uniref:hypothetical protein n=1 Tax=Lentzea sp. NPDC006480 TaxID=3157176 RepID=UPI0033B5E69D